MSKRSGSPKSGDDTVFVLAEAPPPRLKELGGSDRDPFNTLIARQSLGGMWLAHSKTDFENGR